MISAIENFAVCHKDFITLLFTLVLIIISLSSIIIAFLGFHNMRKQILFQEWIFLNNSLYNIQRDFNDVEMKKIGLRGNKRIKADKWTTILKTMISETQSRIDQINFH